MYYSTNNEAKQKYLAKIEVKSILFFGRNKDILNAVLGCFKTNANNYRESSKKKYELYCTLWTEKTERMSSIFSGSESKVLNALLGKEWAIKFKKIWDRSSDYIYSSGYERRSFRTKSFEVLYLTSAVANLEAMIQLVANDFTYEKYFVVQKDNIFSHNPVISNLLALEIDEGNEQVLKSINDLVYGDNNTGLMTREIIKGLLMSHSNQAHKWVGDLLLAAKLQEGLRQTIVECMDEGSKKGFLYLSQVILDQDLVRFSSVVRALVVWTGLGISAQKPAVIKKCLGTGYRCLTDDAYAKECLASNDALLIYMGLWSMAFDDVMSTESPIKHLMSAPENYKRMVALCFLSQTRFPHFQHRLAAPLLADPDDEVKCWVLGNLFSDLERNSIRPRNWGGINKYKRIEGAGSPEELFFQAKKHA